MGLATPAMKPSLQMAQGASLHKRLANRAKRPEFDPNQKSCILGHHSGHCSAVLVNNRHILRTRTVHFADIIALQQLFVLGCIPTYNILSGPGSENSCPYKKKMNKQYEYNMNII
jgi:hypothetical protein